MMAITSDARRFRVLVEQLELPVFVVDNGGTLTHVSPEFAERVGSEGAESLVGESVTQVVTERDADGLVGSGEIPDTVTVQPTQANEYSQQYDLRRVDGEILGCPPPDAVENAEVARALRALHETTRVLRQTESRDETRSVVIESAVDVLGFDRCLLAEADDSAFEVRASSANCPLEAGAELSREATELLDEAYRIDEPRVTDVEATAADPSHPSVRSAITVPVKPWGVFQAQSTTPDSFDDRDRRLAEMLVSSFGAAIKRHRRETQLRGAQERQRHQIEALHTVAAEMKACETSQAVYELTIEAVEEILSFDICAIDEVEDDVLVPKAVGSDMSLDDYYEETPIDQEDNLGSHTYRRGESFVVDDLQAAGYLPAQSRYRSALSLPLGDWGVFQIVSESAGAFDETDCRLVELLAEHAVAAIDRINREAELKHRARELEQQNTRLDEFASIISHDLRNPLNVASLRIEHALETGDTDALETAQEALDRMETIVENVLTLARQGEDIDAPKPVNLRHLVKRCWSRVPTEDATLRIETDRTVSGDSDRLCHLFENLFRNAIEHTQDAVTVEVGDLSGRNGFYVEDDGPGIDAEHRARVFERGYTATCSGTGLGLAIVADVVSAHGWEIRAVESDSGGARFEVTGVDQQDHS